MKSRKNTVFKNLFVPITIGNLLIKNRIVMPAMGTNFGTEDGYVTEQLKRYYEERSKGGAGLIIVEFTCTDAPVGKGEARQLCVDDDKFIPGLSELASVIKTHGAKAVLQLHHAGRLASSRFTGHQPVAPSPIAAPGGEIPRELTSNEIEQLIMRFAAAANRAKKAGFDAVELHCTHNYLLAQFLSAASNRRKDEYGGSLENRSRMLLEILVAVKREVGNRYPVLVRLTGMEFNTENGITVDESSQVARWLEETGSDAINVSASGKYPIHAMQWLVEGETVPRPPCNHPPGYLLFLAEAIKKTVNIPVIGVGRITPPMAEEALKEGKVDMVAIGRGLIADPRLPEKAEEGRESDIRPCIGCFLCRESLLSSQSLRCAVNPSVGREKDAPLPPAKPKRRIVVVGGGPAGMQAAITAAERGHEVALFERTPRLGGQLCTASLPPHKQMIKALTDYLADRTRKLGVTIQLAKEVSCEDVIKLHPDAVVVAAGIDRSKPKTFGFSGDRVVSAEDILTGSIKPGKSVVVIGGGVVGCETAEFLANDKRAVTIVEMTDRAAATMEIVHRGYLLERLAFLGVTMLTGTTAKAIVPEGLLVSSIEGHDKVIQADNIVTATSPRPSGKLYEELLSKVPEIHRVGDCVIPRNIHKAIEEGFLVGMKL